MEELFKLMSEFSDTVFNDATEIEHLKKLIEEANEAIESPKDLSEYADIFLCTIASVHKAGFTLEDLINGSFKKFDIIRNREWIKTEDNLYKHVK